MFSPNNHKPFVTIEKPNHLTASQFTHNLHDQKYHVNHGGRDTYIFDNNGGFYNSNMESRENYK